MRRNAAGTGALRAYGLDTGESTSFSPAGRFVTDVVFLFLITRKKIVALCP